MGHSVHSTETTGKGRMWRRYWLTAPCEQRRLCDADDPSNEWFDLESDHSFRTAQLLGPVNTHWVDALLPKMGSGKARGVQFGYSK